MRRGLQLVVDGTDPDRLRRPVRRVGDQQHHPRRIHPRPLDKLRRGDARLTGKHPGEIARAHIGRLGQVGDSGPCLARNLAQPASGLARQLPRLVAEGFTGKIWCTQGTADLLRPMLADAGRIQEADTMRRNRRRDRAGEEPFEPLYTEADALAASWLRTHPKDVTFMLYMGDRAVAGNDLNAAAGHYQKALDLQPNNPLTLNNLAWVAGKQGRKDALSLVEKADKLAPNNPAILDTWAMLLASEKNFKQAVEVQKRALQIQPDAALYKFNLAQIQVQAGDKAGAKANLQALKQLGDKFNRQAEVDKLLQSL